MSAWEVVSVRGCSGGCSAVTETTDSGNILSLGMPVHGAATVQGALEHYQRKETLADCDCGESCGNPATRTFKFERMPEVLFLQFKYTTVDLIDPGSGLAAEPGVRLGTHSYRLVGGIFRSGAGTEQGHYVAYFPNDGGHTRISDADVS